MFEVFDFEIDDETREYGAFRQAYNERKPVFEKILIEAKKDIALIKLKNQKTAILRIAYIDGRVKSLSSIYKKACDRDIPAKEVFELITDILGLRIVVNNLKDIEPLINELKEHPKFKIHEREEHEGEGGYRAVHQMVSYCHSENDQIIESKLEIQIRTLLQDVWAILTHHDVYKNQRSLPSLAIPISDHLSQSLNALDCLADKFHQHIEAEVEPPNDLSDETPLDRQGIAFLYYDLLGKKPQEYEVDYLNRKVTEFGIQTVGQARKGLDERVLKRLEKIHDKRFPMLSPGMDLLEYGILYSAQGSSALNEYKRYIESAWEEIEQYGREEALSGLPETFDGFIEMIEDGKVPWEAIEELGGFEKCVTCGTKILVPDSAVESILDYYNNLEFDSIDMEIKLSDIADFDSVERESVNTKGVCPYCDHIMSKDD